MVSIRQIVIPTVLLGLLLPSSSFAQSATIGVYNPDYTPACPLPPGEQVLVQVRLNATAGPLSNARFKLVPSCPGATILGPLDYDLTFSPCAQAGDILATLLVTAPNTCSNRFGFFLDVRPATGDAQMTLADCDGFPMTGIDAIQFVDFSPCDLNSSWIAPYRPTPTNGADNVPLNLTLSYVGPANTIHLSMDPNDLNSHLICAPYEAYLPVPECGYPVDPGTLAPNTTYYWRASNISYTFNGPVAVSDIFSFTTGDTPLATEASTWGRVKAMYRD